MESVRRKAAARLGVDPSELIFTGSATETNLFAIRGHWLEFKKNHPDIEKPAVLASRIEHPSVCQNIDFISETECCEIVEIPRTKYGTADLEKTEKLLKQKKFWLCSLQGASNETGIIQPWRQMSVLCQKYEVPVHSDMVQYFGRLPLSFKDTALSSATISFHKSGGIRSCSLLYLKKNTKWTACLKGGKQEKNRWAGTENILGVACIDALFDDLDELLEIYQNKVRRVRDRFEEKLLQVAPDVKIVGQNTERLPNTTYAIFPGVSSDIMLMSLDVKNICASAGSACSSGMALPSSTLEKLGFSEEDAKCAIRFSLGESSNEDQIDQVLEVIAKTIKKVAA